MLDSTLRRLIDPSLNLIGRGLGKVGFTGTTITIIGFVFGLIACLCVAMQYSFFAFVFLMLNRLFDGLDGAVARARKENSDFGGYLDITLDYLIYAGIPFFAAVGLMDASAFLAAAFVIYSFIGSGVSFLAYAIIAEKHGLSDNNHQGKKSFFFASGFMEGTETVIFMILVCLLPDYFEYLCYGFGALCWITTAARINMARQVFR